MAPIISLALAVYLTLLPTVTTAQATSALTQFNSRNDLLGWEAVGRLDMKGTGFCTGTLITPDLVLTAAHCVFDRNTGKVLPPEMITFRAGLRDGVSIADRQVLQIAVPPDYVRQQRLVAKHVRKDVALLRLRAPIVSTDANPFILHSGQIPGNKVSVASYGKGRAQAISRQRSCQVLGTRNDVMVFDCDVTFGSSGAPVFAQTGSHRRIVSVISGMAQSNGKKVALGMTLPSLVASLKAQMRRAPVTAPDRAIVRVRVGSGNRPSGARFIKP